VNDADYYLVHDTVTVKIDIMIITYMCYVSIHRAEVTTMCSETVYVTIWTHMIG